MVAAAGERLVMPSEEFLYDWQTLVAGVLALIAAPAWQIARRAGVSPGTVRVSIGVEDSEDLIADLEQALK